MTEIEIERTLCFNVDGALCVLNINKEKPSEEIKNIMNSIQNWLNQKLVEELNINQDGLIPQVKII